MRPSLSVASLWSSVSVMPALLCLRAPGLAHGRDWPHSAHTVPGHAPRPVASAHRTATDSHGLPLPHQAEEELAVRESLARILRRTSAVLLPIPAPPQNRRSRPPAPVHTAQASALSCRLGACDRVLAHSLTRQAQGRTTSRGRPSPGRVVWC